MTTISAFISGLVFGLGLIVSGMTNPAKVIGFLNIAGPWNPSLALVMAGAILVGVFAFAYAKTRSRSVLGSSMELPANTSIDRKLVLGAVVFGVGWGLAGYCPGPALASLLTGGLPPLVFTVGMLLGMVIVAVADKKIAVADKKN